MPFAKGGKGREAEAAGRGGERRERLAEADVEEGTACATIDDALLLLAVSALESSRNESAGRCGADGEASDAMAVWACLRDEEGVTTTATGEGEEWPWSSGDERSSGCTCGEER